jgi:two-component system response regulator YesN
MRKEALILFKLMVVDDDFWVREYLKKSIKWEDYGILPVYEAENGEEALEKMAIDPVQILIADIKMPVMDGIELAEASIKINPKVKIILLSALKDFEYARKAISLGVADYIVKPVQEEALADVICKVVAELKEDTSKSMGKTARSHIVAQVAPLMKEKLLLKLLCTKLDREEIEKRLQPEFQLKLAGRYIVIAIEIDHYQDQVNEIGMKQAGSIKRTAVDLVKRKLDQFTCSSIIESEGARFICVFPLTENVNDASVSFNIVALCEQLRRQISKECGITVTIGVGSICKGLDCLSTSYQKACYALENKFFLGNDRTIVFTPVERNSSVKTDFIMKYQPMLMKIVLACDTARLQTCIEDLKRELSALGHTEHSYVRHTVLRLAERLTEEIRACRMIDENEITDIYAMGMQVSRAETLDELLDIFKSFLEEVIGYVERQNKNNAQKLIQDIVNYIRKYYDRELYVDEIARVFNTHPSYLSRTFKKETGENLLQFIMRIKIEKAKQLLCNPNIKIMDIAGLIGYENERTFTRIFKKLEGMTPTAFRERVVLDGGGRQSESEPFR